MRPTRALPAILLALVTVAALPGAAVAGYRNQPILADLNGDGYRDRVTLGAVGGTPTCTVTVEYGAPDGTFGPPQVHRYPSVEHEQPYCPDMGVALRLGDRRQVDLVTTFFWGWDLVVLRNFRPVAVYPGIRFPSVIRSAELTGDGREDVFESSDESERFASFTNTPEGTLVPGAVEVRTMKPVPQYVLADFNGDGGQDFVLNDIYTQDGSDERAEVVFGNGGPPVVLVTAPNASTHFVVFATDLDRDGIPDVGVVTTDPTTTTVRYWHCDGHGGFTEMTRFTATAQLPGADPNAHR